MALNKVLKVNNDSELLSFIINTTPELASNIDLPVQGESIAPIGKIIMSNERYKNAFINTIGKFLQIEVLYLLGKQLEN